MALDMMNLALNRHATVCVETMFSNQISPLENSTLAITWSAGDADPPHTNPNSSGTAFGNTRASRPVSSE